MSDFEARKKIIFALWKNTSLLTFLFLTLRTLLLPLDKLHLDIVNKGNIVEIGSGHGVVIAYLALRSKKRKVIGFDPDDLRTNVAKSSFSFIENITFYEKYFDNDLIPSYNCVIIYGTLCLMDDQTINNLFSKIKENITQDGSIYISDILKQKKFIYYFHIFRENFFKKINFTKGDVVIARKLDEWSKIFLRNNFNTFFVVKTKVLFHSTVDFLIKIEK